jgi:hypothetical protein
MRKQHKIDYIGALYKIFYAVSRQVYTIPLTKTKSWFIMSLLCIKISRGVVRMPNGILQAFLSLPNGKYLIDQLLAGEEMATEELTPANVYKEGKPSLRLYTNQLVQYYQKPGSALLHGEHLKELFDLSQAGHSCLLLPEHYSNFDLVNICALTDHHPLLGPQFADQLIAVAGAKMSLEDPFIASMVKIYNRMVIFPSRGINAITDPVKREAMQKYAAPINLASMKEMTTRKYHKNMFLVFPSGTRIRPWDEETKKGVPEIYSYLRAFEYICLLSINGNNLRIPSDSQHMSDDVPTPDVIMLGASPVMKTKDFLAQCAASFDASSGSDIKTYTAQCVMKHLFSLHDEVEQERKKFL